MGITRIRVPSPSVETKVCVSPECWANGAPQPMEAFYPLHNGRPERQSRCKRCDNSNRIRRSERGTNIAAPDSDSDEFEDESDLFADGDEHDRNKLDAARWSNEVIALIRSGVPLRRAWLEANEPFLEPVSDAPSAPIRRAREREPLDLFSTSESRAKYGKPVPNGMSRPTAIDYFGEHHASETPAKAPPDGPHREAGHVEQPGNAHPDRRQDVGEPEPRRDTAAHSRVEQLVARRAHNPKAVRSNRTPATDRGGEHGASRESGSPSGEIGGAQVSNLIRARAKTAPAHVGSTTARGIEDFEKPSGEGAPSSHGSTDDAPVEPCKRNGAGTPRAGTPAAAPGGGLSASPPRPALVQVMSVDRFVGEHMPQNTGLIDRIRSCLADGRRADIVTIQKETGDPPAKIRAALDYQERQGRARCNDKGEWHLVGKTSTGKSAKAATELRTMVREKLTAKPKVPHSSLIAGFPPPPSVPNSTAFVTNLLHVRAQVIESALRKVAKLDELIASHAE